MDNTPEDIGKAFCELHEYVLTYPDNWEDIISIAGLHFASWLMHPDGRNWNLVDQIKKAKDAGTHKTT